MPEQTEILEMRHRAEAEDYINKTYDKADSNARKANEIAATYNENLEISTNYREKLGRITMFRCVISGIILFTIVFGFMLLESSINKESLAGFLYGMADSDSFLGKVGPYSGFALALLNIVLGHVFFEKLKQVDFNPVTGKKDMPWDSIIYPLIAIGVYMLVQLALIKAAAGDSFDSSLIRNTTLSFAVLEFFGAGFITSTLWPAVDYGNTVLKLRRLARKMRRYEVKTGQHYAKYQRALESYNGIYSPAIPERQSAYINSILHLTPQENNQNSNNQGDGGNDAPDTHTDHTDGNDQTTDDFVDSILLDEDNRTDTEPDDYNI